MNGWYKIIGGPVGGGEYYSSSEPRPGQHVNIRRRFDVWHNPQWMPYFWSKDGKTIVFQEQK